MAPDPPPAAPRTKTHDIAVAGWRSRNAAFVTAVITVEALTGLWIYLLPFSVTGQIQVLLHVVLGLVFAVPYVVYQWRHLSDWARQTPTAAMVLGYVLGAAVATCVVTGLVLAWQSALGPRIGETWDLVHTVSGLAVTVLLPFHLVLVFLRRRAGGRAPADIRLAQRTFARRAGIVVGASTLAVVAGALLLPERDYTSAPPEGYSLPASTQGYAEYAGNPFAPSNATTDHRTLIESELLAGSAYCGTSGCHEEIVDEWEPSAHRFAAANPPFQAVQRMFATDREPAETRYCAGCHDPISLFAGAKDIANMDLAAPGMQEGISCVVCHAISKADTRGNADYVLTPPRRYLFEGSSGLAKFTSDFLIRAYPWQHLEDYDRNILRTPEFCAACHKQFIPEALNNFGFVEGQNQYDEWLNSHWHSDDAEADLSCTDCHMRLVADSRDPGHGEADSRRTADDGAHRHHGFIATNSFMPAVMKLPHYEEQVRLTEEWIRGDTVLPEIAHLWPEGPVVALDLLGLPDTARAGDEVTFRVQATNRKAGHNFTTGPLDFVRAWVHLEIVDGDGTTITEWGGIDPTTRRITDTPGREHTLATSHDGGTMVFESVPIDEDGKEIVRHQLWRKAGGQGKRVVFPGYSDIQTYVLRIPADAKGPITIRAALNYRRYRQEFLDLVVPEMETESGVLQPTTTQASCEKLLQIAR